MMFRIRELRNYFGLSQSELARRIGKTDSYIARIETGKTIPSQKTIDDICSAFQINRSWLLCEDEEMFLKGKEKSCVDLENIGARVKMIRKGKKLTQKAFAEAADCSKDQIYSVESGRVKPSREWLQKIAARFEINEEWLLTGSGQINSVKSEPAAYDEIVDYMRENDQAREIVSQIIQREEPAVWEDIRVFMSDRENKRQEENSDK